MSAHKEGKDDGCEQRHNVIMNPVSSLVMYSVMRTQRVLPVDGDLSKPEWLAAEKSPRFVDMASGAPGWYDTRAAALWDDEALRVAFWVQDPYPRAQLTERDSIIFSESDVEVFIDGGDCYYELEINALNTLYEVFFIWQDAFDRFEGSDFSLKDALSFGGNFDRTESHFWTGTHPRGPRWAFRNWDFPGIETAVQIQGTLNDDSKPSLGWTCEVKLPWRGMKELSAGRALPPSEGDVWKLFLGRFQKLRMDHGEVNPAWCWTAHGLYDTHQPDSFTPVRFVRTVVGTN